MCASYFPGEEHTFELRTTDRHGALGYPGQALSMRFIDSAGVTWVRDDRGIGPAPSSQQGEARQGRRRYASGSWTLREVRPHQRRP